MAAFYDAHCHLSPFFVKNEFDVRDGVCINLMSTNQFDVYEVFKLSKKYENIIPCYGIHPWYSHLFTFDEYDGNLSKEEFKKIHYLKVLTNMGKKIDSFDDNDKFLSILPFPIFIKDYISNVIEKYIKESKDSMIGEIGLDKLFRIPSTGYFGYYRDDKEEYDNNDKKLTNYKVSMDHQILIFKEFLKISLIYEKPISLHCVKAHGILLDIVQKFCLENTKITICLHSYTGSIDQSKNWIKLFKNRIFFSFSKIINLAKDEIFCELINIIPDKNILIETDLGIDNYYNLNLNLKYDNKHIDDLNQVIYKISYLKNWNYDFTKSKILENWNNFKK
ncbi:hypothetical protein PACTADRAFT_50305 [Pachysolen tannophilus NRRL Y-2460]|uniref:Uncharacterized protein n=1 Tax=Pachysolen tannophilus NRRL Y-2460 TaxID=669874 RepID=A0A1E4TV28_PACTA|nr:hypothetical protein PACTADRAFT_50305 [Pachysolen tannophilus NRRL Y-2460]